jgi:hypothetical protein
LSEIKNPEDDDMSDQDKAAKAAANKAKKEAAAKELAAELRAKHPQLDEAELLKLAQIEMRRKALDAQAQRVLNPRVNSKADTRRKIIVGALVLTDSTKNNEVRQYLKKLLSSADLKESDRKLFADILFMTSPSPQQQPRPQTGS